MKENCKNRTVMHCYPGIFDLPCIPRTIFHGCQNVLIDPLNAIKYCPQYNTYSGYVYNCKCMVSMATHDSNLNNGVYLHNQLYLSCFSFRFVRNAN